MEISFLHTPIFTWVILPLLIFIARVCDVTLGTIRIIFVAKGKKYIAPMLGFFEALIWLTAMGQIMQNLTNVAAYLAYAGGFAMGNFVGILIEEKLAMGILIVRIITVKDATELIKHLGARGYGVTCVDAMGSTGPVKLIYTIIKRKNYSDVVSIIKEFNPKAFYSIEDARMAYEGIFPVVPKTHLGSGRIHRLKMRRKAK